MDDETGRSQSRPAPGLPKYQQVANDLMRQIATGAYPVGSLLPREVELSARYRITRHTVREALRRLDEVGLISRRRRAGTSVIAVMPSANYKQPINSIEDLLQYGEDTRVHLLRLTRIRCNVALASLLECEVGTDWVRLETLRTQLGDSPPICLTMSYVITDLPGIEEAVRNLEGPISALLERNYGLRITRIDQSIQAVQLKNREARLLGAKPGGPALRAMRRYYDSTRRLIEFSDAIHPSRRFTYTTQLVRG
ncbi:MAG: GntR family transcriptional regulator [Acidobacteriaceae bacterium]